MAVINYHREFAPKYFGTIGRRQRNSKIHELRLPVVRTGKGTAVIDEDEGALAITRHRLYPVALEVRHGVGTGHGGTPVVMMMPHRGAVSNEELEQALRDHGGSQSAAAMALSLATGLRVSRQAVHERIRRNEHLRRVLAESRAGTDSTAPTTSFTPAAVSPRG
jgi:hypothetical protein